eukprot:3811138-Alexandrium_andersonii.AAC.1
MPGFDAAIATGTPGRSPRQAARFMVRPVWMQYSCMISSLVGGCSSHKLAEPRARDAMTTAPTPSLPRAQAALQKAETNDPQ